jgi:invasion protein IalB
MTSRILMATAAFLLSFPALAQDQPAKPTAGAPAAPAAAQQGDETPKLSGPQPDWTKVCSQDPQAKREFCQISRDLRGETGQTLASVAVREVKGAKRMLVMAIPPGTQIQPGVRVFVDKTQVGTGKFSVCMQNACFVESEMTDAMLAIFKKGTLLTLQAVNVQGRGMQLRPGARSEGVCRQPEEASAATDRARQQGTRRTGRRRPTRSCAVSKAGATALQSVGSGTCRIRPS